MLERGVECTNDYEANVTVRSPNPASQIAEPGNLESSCIRIQSACELQNCICLGIRKTNQSADIFAHP